MRKKELMNRLNELVSTVEDLYLQINILKKENEDLKERLNKPIEEAEHLTATEINTTAEGTASDGFTVSVVDEISFCEDETEETTLSNDALEFGAGVIGRLTIEAAKFCDKITESGRENSNELLALIMGRSEVCKNEILSIAMSGLSHDTMMENINTQFKDAVEYFNCVLEQ